jgi:hypothetical protein
MIGQNEVRPHTKRSGWLKNGNPPGNLTKALRCNAKTRNGSLCKAPAMRNGRCRMHGGKSTGPKTREGIERIRAAHMKHGEFTKEAQEDKKYFRSLLKSLKGTIQEIHDISNGIDISIKK